MAFLLVLFWHEERRGKKYALRFRLKLDHFAQNLNKSYADMTQLFGTGSLRMTMHFVTHRVLTYVARLTQFLHTYLNKLQMRHRKIVHEARKERSSSHLEAMQEHKKNVALSEEEKRRLRERFLSGE